MCDGVHSALKAGTVTTKYYQSFHADDRGGATYAHQLREARADDDDTLVEELTAHALKFAQEATGTTLHPFCFSMWSCFVLKYTGREGSFGWHYDSEDRDDVRVLVCVRRTPTAGAVQYVDREGDVRTVDLREGQAYVLRGSTTFHRVLHNASPDDQRVMIGFHFTSVPNKVTKNLCYLATLTGWRVRPVLGVLLRQVMTDVEECISKLPPFFPKTCTSTT